MQIKQTKSLSANAEVQLIVKNNDLNIPDFEAKLEEIRIIYSGNRPTVYVGLGDAKEVSLEAIRKAAAKGVLRIKSLKKQEFAFFVPELENFSKKEIVYAICESALLSIYEFDKYKTKEDNTPKELGLMELIVDGNFETEINEAKVVCQSVNIARDLVNENAEVMTTIGLQKEAEKIAEENNLDITVLDENEIQKQGLGLLYAVGKGSIFPPRLIVLEYRGNKNGNNKIAIVGKGLTFDTGGLNLKPSGSIENMREDMAGAAAVLGIMSSAAKLKLPINLVGVIPSACNAIGPKSYFPGDIYKSYSGKTVQIKNTDAEGRLILADALNYTVKNYKPSLIVNLATLTGAIVTTFSTIVAGLFSNNDELAKDLFESGEKTFERLWRLPLYKEYRDAMKGEFADLNNISNLGKGEGGSITGAAFLQEFVEDTPWAHIDIAGVAFNEKSPKGYIPKYGTGFGVRLMVEWLRRRS